jgi:antitoxin (DNA-binding transcriptional repressor) of toxin-antitoxin stability system
MTVIVNIQQAKTHLSGLVEQATEGHGLVIAQGGQADVVQVVPLQAPSALGKLGFPAGQGTATAGLKEAFAGDIDAMIEGPR